MKQTRITILVEGAVMIALAAVLSYIRVFKLPTGGSVTLMSMLPIIVFSIRYGVKHGLGVAFGYSLVQLVQGAMDGLFAWGLSAPMLIACIVLDYLGAFTVIGFAGIFRSRGASGWVAGTIFAGVLRFVFHFFSGVVIWRSCGELWSGFDINNVWLYSLAYNGIYMLPEILFTSLGAYALFRVPATRRLLKAA
ncbi:MAG: proton-coupled thiamine transporter YuaJ [Ruminococcus sp.]|nr:proton-coupled thiamine transporter YuaJ [Ruminococcus sp.]